MSSRLFYLSACAVAMLAMIIGLGAPWPLAVTVVGFLACDALGSHLGSARIALAARLEALEHQVAKTAEVVDEVEALKNRLVRVENRTGRTG